MGPRAGSTGAALASKVVSTRPPAVRSRPATVAAEARPTRLPVVAATTGAALGGAVAKHSTGTRGAAETAGGTKAATAACAGRPDLVRRSGPGTSRPHLGRAPASQSGSINPGVRNSITVPATSGSAVLKASACSGGAGATAAKRAPLLRPASLGSLPGEGGLADASIRGKRRQHSSSSDTIETITLRTHESSSDGGALGGNRRKPPEAPAKYRIDTDGTVVYAERVLANCGGAAAHGAASPTSKFRQHLGRRGAHSLNM